MQKIKARGQLFLYIIIAILIIAIGLLVYFISQEVKKARWSEEEMQAVKNGIKDCLEKGLKEGIWLLARQGGYYELPSESAEFLGERAAFYLKQGKSLIPTKRTLELQLRNYLKNETSCIAYSYESLEVYLRNNRSEVEVRGIKASKGRAAFVFDVDADVAIDLLSYIALSEEIVQSYNATNPYVCIECIDMAAIRHAMNVTIVPIAEKGQIWFLLASGQKVDNKNLIWRFVADIK
jgi:hypothetical protein